jgi:hypothetical protein
MALNSSTVSSGDLATSEQYNDLRSDAVSTSSGHVHDGTLGIGSAQFILNVTGVPLLLQNTTDAVSNEGLRMAGGNRATPADNDEVYLAAYLDICTGVQTEMGRLTHKILDVTTCTKDSRWEFQQYTANTLREVVVPVVTADDTFAMVTLAQTLAGKTLTTPTISGTGFCNANHAHAATNSGGTLNASAIAAGTLTHERGGLEFDASSITTGGLVRGASSGVMSILTIGSSCQVLTVCGGAPVWKDSSGGVTLSGSTNNTVATVTGACALIGEANLLYNGTLLSMTTSGASTKVFEAIGTSGGNAGPGVAAYHNSASPADNDSALRFFVSANDSGATKRDILELRMRFCDVTASTMNSSIQFFTMCNSSADADTNASLTSAGVWTDASAAVDKTYEGPAETVWGGTPGQVITDKIKALNIGRYHSSHVPDHKPITERHVSPTAEDLWETFGVGRDPHALRLQPDGTSRIEAGISAKDLGGIALMAIQELTERIEVLEARP